MADIHDIIPFQSSFAEKKISLKTHFVPGSLCIEYDPKMWEGILYNIISNAVKFTPDNGHITLETYLDENRKEFICSIKDSGPGIPESEMNKIFDRFYQVQDYEHYKTEGSGFGLAIIKEFIQKMQRSVEAKNLEPAGLQFTIKLPAKIKQVESIAGILTMTPRLKLAARNKKFQMTVEL